MDRNEHLPDVSAAMIAQSLERDRLSPAQLASFNDSLRHPPHCRALRDMDGGRREMESDVVGHIVARSLGYTVENPMPADELKRHLD